MLKATEEKNIFSDKNIEAYGYASKQRAGMIWSPFAWNVSYNLKILLFFMSTLTESNHLIYICYLRLLTRSLLIYIYIVMDFS